ncbi:MAG TPA: hypothetical protein DE315_01795 [Candidatus Omnitrophica bacterium]|nr:hypothetical protein [Candidatus Omnitrophota bacterium]HCI44252.1 hypothetical protein [Candidatus Omnitrophota bacterium]
MNKLLRHLIAGVTINAWGMSAPVTGYAQDIRDIKPPVAFPAPWMLLLIALAVILLAGIAHLVYQRYQRQRVQAVNKIIAKTPWEKAYERLEELRKSDLLARGQWEQYYLILSDIVRRYFEERFSVRAPEMTSEEFLTSLKNFGGLAPESKVLLEEFLVVCDMVKFAKHAPDAAAGEKNADLARRLIDETKS